MPTHSRPERVGQEIQAAIGQILSRGELRDPRIGFITITGVKVSPDLRVARSLAALFNPVLYPGVGEILRITQQELAYLVGLSRQRVNESLSTLQEQGIIRVEYGGLRILDLAALRSSIFQPRPHA